MICACEQLIKKRTLVDGIKSLSGVLNVYCYNGSIYLRECCFCTLVPSLYTFINHDWFLHGEMILVGTQMNATPLLVYKITPDIRNLIVSYAKTDPNDNLLVVEITSNISLLGDAYIKHSETINKAHQTVIHLEKLLKEIQYKYSATIYDNELLTKQLNLFQDRAEAKARKHSQDEEETELANYNDRIDSSKIANNCNLCKSMPAIRADLKRIKADSINKISKMQYDHEIDQQKLAEVSYENQRLREENTRLRDENRLLRATTSLDYDALYALD